MTRRRTAIFRNGDRDANEPMITTVLSRLNIPFVVQPPQAGFDLLVLTSPPELWEVKNPSYKWTLTRSEHERQKYCRANGITYRVIETIEQAADAIAERR